MNSLLLNNTFSKNKAKLDAVDGCCHGWHMQTLFAENQNLFPRRVLVFIAKGGGRCCIYDAAHSIKASGSRERLAMCSRRVLHLKRHRIWEKIYKCDPLQRHSYCLPCASRTERVKLQEGRESRSPVTYVEIVLTSYVPGSSLSHVRSRHWIPSMMCFSWS